MKYFVEIQIGVGDEWTRSTTYGGDYKESELKCLKARIKRDGIDGAKYRIQGTFTHSIIKP